MKKIILYFLIVLGAIWLGIKIYQHPGYIVVMYQQWIIESTVWFLLLLLALVFLLFHFLLNLIKQTRILPKRIERWLSKRKVRKSIRFLNQGYSELILGKWRKAEKHFLKSSKNESLSFINNLLAAETADAASDEIKRNSFLLRAQSISPEDSFTVEVLRAEFFLNNNQPDQALVLLTKLREEKPREVYLLKLLTESYLSLGDYVHLQPLLNEIKKAKVFSPNVFSELEKETYLHILRDQFFSDYSQIQSLWNKIPKHLRHDPDILIAYSKHLLRWNRVDEAEEQIRKELKKHYNNLLMQHYATLKSKHPAKQLALGEKWLKQHSDDPVTLSAMGTMCLKNRLWGQAKDYIEASQKIAPNPQNFLTLGYIYEKLGENERALHYYRRGLKAQTLNQM